MDLLQTVRKEGSRGGVDFKWDDVKSSNHRENYLGHSLMAPVGRWQKNRDLNWYAKADDAEKTPEEIAAEEKQRRLDELRKVREAEEDAMARALGLPVPDRSANTEPLGENRLTQKEVNAVLKDVLAGNGATEWNAIEQEVQNDEDQGRRTDDETWQNRPVAEKDQGHESEIETDPCPDHLHIDDDEAARPRGRLHEGGVENDGGHHLHDHAADRDHEIAGDTLTTRDDAP